MDTANEKQVRITDDRARRLHRLAIARGTTEDALIEKALDLLFSETECVETWREDQELLEHLESELGAVQPSSAPPIEPGNASFVVGTAIPPERVRRPGGVR